MSAPNIPDIDPRIHLKEEDIRNLLLASVSLEELALAHLLNAEGEKIQKVLEYNPSLHHLSDVDASVRRILKAVVIKTMLLDSKMEDILKKFDYDDGCEE